MSSANAGWLFYKKSFFHLDEDSSSLDDKLLKKVNDELLSKKFEESSLFQSSKHGFRLKTIYPGLIIGSGYSHGAKDSKENFQLGFFFDYTTGYPVIAGSSVKGVIRSFFKRLENSDEKDLILEFFQDTLKEIGFNKNIDEKFLKNLENEIFEGVSKDGNRISEYERDIFCDAFIIGSANDGEKIFDEDYITPHDNPLSDPNPNRFLKILPEITFRFNFDLKDSTIDDDLKAKHKELLFLKLLEFNGVGAKTNVGYGQFNIEGEEKRLKNKLDDIIEQEMAEQKQKELENMSPIDRIFTENDDNVVKIIFMMQNGEIEDYESIKLELAQKIKEELQKNPKFWERAKQKALKRKEFIESILSE